MQNMTVRTLARALGAVVVALVVAAAAPQDRRLEHGEPSEVATLPAAAKRFALVVGVDRYDDPQISPLNGAGNDARALAGALVRYAGFPADQVVVLAGDADPASRPTRANILRRLANLRGVVPRDGLLLVSFAGHGIERDGRGYLLPADAQALADLALLEDTAVSVDRLRALVAATGVRQVLMLVDACRNDPAAGRGEADNRLTESFTRGFRFEVANRGVEAFATLYAAAVGERAFEDRRREQGYFTAAVVDALSGAASGDDGQVTLGELVAYLQTTVPRRIALDLGAEKRQRPFAVVEGYRADQLVVAVADAPPPTPGPAGGGVHHFESPRVDERGVVRERLAGTARVEVERIAEGVALEMVRLEGGSFLMGTADEEVATVATELRRTVDARYAELMAEIARTEAPQHEVRVSPFAIGRTEVTQAQWAAVARLPRVGRDLEEYPSHWTGSDLPVESVTWYEAVEFCERLSRATGRRYRLPTEAEWEYACRAGETGPFGFGANLAVEVANYASASPWRLAPPVARRRGTVAAGSTGGANRWGLVDMHGNVAEWCADWFGPYGAGAAVDPTGPATGQFRVYRGGSYADAAARCRSAVRGNHFAYLRSDTNGFRVARDE